MADRVLLIGLSDSLGATTRFLSGGAAASVSLAAALQLGRIDFIKVKAVPGLSFHNLNTGVLIRFLLFS